MRAWCVACVLALYASAAAQPSDPSLPGQAQPHTSVPVQPGVGPPASIELSVVSDRFADFVHAQRAPNSQLQVKAIIRDANGNFLGNSVPGCTPAYRVENTLGAQAAVGQTAANGTALVNFGATPGVFGVSVSCVENPAITSAGANHPPYNFESSNSPFAPGGESVAERVKKMREAMDRAAKKPPPPATPATPAPTPDPAPSSSSSSKKKGTGILGLAAVGVGTYLLVDWLLDSSSASDCSCMCNKTGVDCSSGGSATCEANCTDLLSGCGICRCESGCSPSFTARRSPDLGTLIGAELRREREQRRLGSLVRATIEQRIAAQAPARPAMRPMLHRAASPRPIRTVASFAHRARRSLAAAQKTPSWAAATTTLRVAAAVYSAVVMLRRSPESAGTDVVPWLDPETLGISVVGRF